MFGGHGRGWRHRRTYYATGVPGLGRGRCAGRYAAPPPGAGDVGPWPQRPSVPAQPVPDLDRDEELRMLEEEEDMLEEELEDLRKALEGLREERKKEVNK